MINGIKNIIKSLKKVNKSSESLEPNVIITSAKFTLSYKELSIGFLEFSPKDDSWTFSYSDEFKNQNTIAPIISFPDKNKIYNGKELWSFFSSRIPDNVGSSVGESKTENKALLDLLQSYGRKTITNPFDLSVG
ncbi:MAG: hypothetical protein RL264_490 [Bacteroidota bacterium]|jgi:HipA-like protein